ncbi:unnamed protein product [Cuscuta campestris]|uniref:CCHC-type domain-containing protein n=1 Tax=Cuscuta campestris TaxID=132261 RepID=A0A484KAF5_9ASTE|nr:unnamed protein product [Cuscuta campestris]
MSSSGSGSHFAMPKFDGKSSFTLWQRRMKDLLVHLGLSRALKGDEAKPEKMSDNDWQELCEKCVSTIRLCIANSVVNCVIDEESPAAIWEKLEKLYMAKSLTNKLLLKRRLYRLRMEDEDTLVGHMNVFNGLIDELKRVDVKINEEDQALLLLNSLPDSYEVYVDTILCGKDTITLEQEQSALLSFDAKRKDKAGVRSDDAVAAIAHGGGRCRSSIRDYKSKHGRFKSQNAPKNEVHCYKCGELGHIRRDCPKKREGKNDANLVRDGETGSSSLGNESDELFMVANGYDEASGNDWVLDSACVSHMCSRKEHFEKLQEGMTKILRLADNSTVAVMGVGVVKMKMFDGVVRTLGNMAYVPKLRWNLISLSQLDSEGYEYKARGEVVRVTKGSTVVIKGELDHGLYRMVGHMAKSGSDHKSSRRVSFVDEATMVHGF